jgi:isocitrate/isopropylmalate dehydrogenase
MSDIKTKKTVVALGGDGIGPEVVDATCSLLLNAGFNLNIIRPLNGEMAVRQGKEPFSDETKKLCDSADAVIFGAADQVSTPILFHLRWANKHYLLERPIKYFTGARSCAKDPTGIDFVMFRELSEDLYPGQEGDLSLLAERLPDYRGSMGAAFADYGKGKFAIRIISELGVRRLAEHACNYTMQRKRDGYPGKLTCVTKSNILKQSCGLFQRLTEEEAKKYPGLTYEHYYVDDMARRLIRYPKDFDVVVISNMFGDILSDEAAELAGGLGLAGSAAYGGKVPLFEPTHGSAPKYAGKNVINPTATILSAKMMLAYLQMNNEAKALENAVAAVYKEGKHLTYDQGGKATTTDCADAILHKIK